MDHDDAPSLSALQLDKQICFSLYRASNAMIRAYRPLLDELGLTYLQYLVLMVLWDRDGLNLGELGQQLGLDSGTLTPLIKRLESKALVFRQASQTDERVKHIYLSNAGKALKKDAACIPEKQLQRVNLSLGELKQLKQLCDRLIINEVNQDS